MTQQSKAVLQGLAPVLDANTRLLILGSFPGVASLQAQQYYGHPRNAFWAILSAVWQLPLQEMQYAHRLNLMQSRGVGLWDVCRACVRPGSLDANMRDEEANDFSLVAQACPRLEAVAHNGAKSFQYRRLTQALSPQLYALPSTSRAHASWSFERKLGAWAEVLQRHSSAPAGSANAVRY